MPVTGLASMRRAFAELGVDMDTKALPRALRKVAQKVAVVAARKAPEDDGNLRRSIKAKRVSKRTATKQGLTVGFVVAPMSKGGKPERTEKGAKPASVYGAFVEEGTEDQLAQPYMRPAADESASSLSSELRVELSADLIRTAKRVYKPKANR